VTAKPHLSHAVRAGIRYQGYTEHRKQGYAGNRITLDPQSRITLDELNQ
jgi:hypothetical protein